MAGERQYKRDKLGRFAGAVAGIRRSVAAPVRTRLAKGADREATSLRALQKRSSGQTAAEYGFLARQQSKTAGQLRVMAAANRQGKSGRQALKTLRRR